MVIRTFLDKCTTIFKDINENFGLYPVIMLNHGLTLSRALLHFDISLLKQYKNEGYFQNISKLKHILKLTNCGSINERTFSDYIILKDKNGIKKRAVSFDLLLFKLPKSWDEGIGFDYSSDIWFNGDTSVSKEGCNWFNSTSDEKWDENGIYSINTLYEEYEKFKNNEESIIIDTLHFDHGNENINLDITNYVNSLINESGTTENYGIGLSFLPNIEESDEDIAQYVGFFTNNTNTFFKPYIETIYDNSINDDRYNFILGKTNKLYFYAYINGELTNLDNLPSCIIEGLEYAVKQETKGVYYVEVKLDKENYSKDMILEDIWSNITYNGEVFDEISQEFVTKSNKWLINTNDSINNKFNYNVTINGIKDSEHISSDDIRIMTVIFRKKYTTDEYDVIRNAKYRLYVKNGNKEIDVIDWDNINSTYNTNYFYLDTNTLLPNDYHIDIKLESNGGMKIFKDKLKFTIVSNITDEKK